MVSVPSVVEERTPSGEAHAVRDRELRVRSTRHWENNIVTRPLEKLLAISQKSEKKCQKQMHPGKQHSSQSVWLLVLAEAWKPWSSTGQGRWRWAGLLVCAAAHARSLTKTVCFRTECWVNMDT